MFVLNVNRSKFYLLLRNAFTDSNFRLSSLKLFFFVGDRENVNLLIRDPRKMLLGRFVKFLNEHFPAVESCAFNLV